MGKNNDLGAWGEKLAASYLRKKHYKIIETGYRCRFGEIDIIASSGAYLVFVEVKLRRNDRFSRACEAVTLAKQNRLRQTALQWTAQYGEPKESRFDVIEIYTQTGEVCHIEGAFM
jgi:putative endonuclease